MTSTLSAEALAELDLVCARAAAAAEPFAATAPGRPRRGPRRRRPTRSPRPPRNSSRSPHGRDRAHRGAPERRARAHRGAAAAVQRRRARRRLPRRPDRPGGRRLRPRHAPGRPADADARRPGRQLRGGQLPVRVLGGGRRHRRSARGRLPRHPEGPLGSPRARCRARREIVAAALEGAGMPEGVFQFVSGQEEGVAILRDPRGPRRLVHRIDPGRPAARRHRRGT